MPRSMMSAPALRAIGLGAVDLLEHVGRQAADAVEVFHGPGSSAGKPIPSRPADIRFYHGLRAPPAAVPAVARATSARCALRVLFRSSRRRLLSASLSAVSAARRGHVMDRRIGRRRRRPLPGRPSGRPPIERRDVVDDRRAAGQRRRQQQGRRNRVASRFAGMSLSSTCCRTSSRGTSRRQLVRPASPNSVKSRPIPRSHDGDPYAG